jgi:hypothetical protein
MNIDATPDVLAMAPNVVFAVVGNASVKMINLNFLM